MTAMRMTLATTAGGYGLTERQIIPPTQFYLPEGFAGPQGSIDVLGVRAV